MSANKLLQAAAGNAGELVYVDEVFATNLYTGDGGTGQDITNGIDLSGEGGMVWFKSRTTTNANNIYDTARGNGQLLYANTTEPQYTNATNPWTPSSTGFNTGDDWGGSENQSGADTVAWTFRKQAGFFDVVTYTGDGSSTRNIAHNLGSAPGMILLKVYSHTDDWWVYHRSLNDNSGNPYFLKLNSNAAEDSGGGIFTTPSATHFGVRTNSNTNGYTYVAYLFAHDDQQFGDDSDEDIIQCGTYSTDSSGNATVNLGFEPQWVMNKTASSADNWTIADSLRGFGILQEQRLYANLTNIEAAASVYRVTSTGFTVNSGETSKTFIYVAIRRPHKPPEAGTEVYAPIARSGNSTNNTEIAGGGFPLDWVVTQGRNAAIEPISYTRLQYHNKKLLTYSTAAEASSSTSVLKSFLQDGFKVGTDTDINNSSYTYIYWFFKRAAKFMDIVAYTGTGASRALTHNLNVAPELIFFKIRSTTDNWMVASTATTATMFLNTTGSESSSNYSDRFTSFTDTAINFSGVSSSYVNENNKTYIAWLFATLPGVSKCGTYTGTGAAQNIDCGFSGTARFILIKSRDEARGWFVYDSARGIVAGNDPYQLWNAAGSETTSTDYIDPYAGGFALSGSNDLNVSSEKYLFLAIA